MKISSDDWWKISLNDCSNLDFLWTVFSTPFSDFHPNHSIQQWYIYSNTVYTALVVGMPAHFTNLHSPFHSNISYLWAGGSRCVVYHCQGMAWLYEEIWVDSGGIISQLNWRHSYDHVPIEMSSVKTNVILDDGIILFENCQGWDPFATSDWGRARKKEKTAQSMQHSEPNVVAARY